MTCIKPEDTIIIQDREVVHVIDSIAIGPRGNNGDSVRKNPEFSYNDDGQLITVEWPDGSFANLSRDENDLLTTVEYRKGSQTGTRNLIYDEDPKLIRIEDE